MHREICQKKFFKSILNFAEIIAFVGLKIRNTEFFLLIHCTRSFKWASIQDTHIYSKLFKLVVDLIVVLSNLSSVVAIAKTLFSKYLFLWCCICWLEFWWSMKQIWLLNRSFEIAFQGVWGSNFYYRHIKPYSLLK